jgi:hypothetical protein
LGGSGVLPLDRSCQLGASAGLAPGRARGPSHGHRRDRDHDHQHPEVLFHHLAAWSTLLFLGCLEFCDSFPNLSERAFEMLCLSFQCLHFLVG